MSEPLLHIRNNHTAACGDPPIVNSNDPALYIGYFENAYGEVAMSSAPAAGKLTA